MPIEDDAWGAPVPLDEPPASTSGGSNGPRVPRRALLVGAGVLLVAVVVVVIVVASGGGGSGGSTGGLSKAQWIQKADAVCGRTFPQQAQDLSNRDLAGATELAQQALTEIRALGVPTSDASQVRQYVSEEQQVVNLFESAVASSTSTNPSTAESDLLQGEQLVRSAAVLAGQIGMMVCNSGQ